MASRQCGWPVEIDGLLSREWLKTVGLVAQRLELIMALWRTINAGITKRAWGGEGAAYSATNQALTSITPKRAEPHCLRSLVGDALPLRRVSPGCAAIHRQYPALPAAGRRSAAGSSRTPR
jgi:hypothetical protein